MALTWAGTLIVGAVIGAGAVALLGKRKPRTDLPTQPAPNWSDNPLGRLGFMLGVAGFLGYNYSHGFGSGGDVPALDQPLGAFTDAAPLDPPPIVDVSAANFSSGGDFS